MIGSSVLESPEGAVERWVDALRRGDERRLAALQERDVVLYRGANLRDITGRDSMVKYLLADSLSVTGVEHAVITPVGNSVLLEAVVMWDDASTKPYPVLQAYRFAFDGTRIRSIIEHLSPCRIMEPCIESWTQWLDRGGGGGQAGVQATLAFASALSSRDLAAWEELWAPDAVLIHWTPRTGEWGRHLLAYDVDRHRLGDSSLLVPRTPGEHQDRVVTQFHEHDAKVAVFRVDAQGRIDHCTVYGSGRTSPASQIAAGLRL